MLLAVMWDEYPAALRADFQREYQLNIGNLPDHATLGWVADLAAELPPGAMVWRHVGGPMAWTDETHMLSAVEFNQRVLAWMKTEDGANNRNAPKPIDPPEIAGTPKTEEMKDARALRRAMKYMERQKEAEGDGD